MASLLAVAMMASVSTTVFADEQEKSEINNIQPRYVSSCPVASKHAMEGRGVGYIYSGSAQNPGTREVYGFTTQCANCNLVLVSEGNIWYSGTVGKYSFENASGKVAGGVIMYGGIAGSFYGNIAQDSFWAGFDF